MVTAHDMSDVEVKEVDHWSTSDFKGKRLRAFEVFLKGEKIGSVTQEVEHVHKKAGRLIYKTTKRLRWQNQAWPNHRFIAGIYYTSRKAAVEDLLETYYRSKS